MDDPRISAWQKWRYSMHLFAGLGELWLALEDSARAADFADRCHRQAEASASRKYLAWAWRLRGEIAVARRQWDEAERAHGQALAAARAIGNPTHVWKTHAAIGRLHDARHDAGAARAAYDAAREVLDGVRSRLAHPELRASLEALIRRT